MTTTTYSFHRADDHSIIATAGVGDVAKVAHSILGLIPDSSGHVPVYVHNGAGVVAAILIRHGAAAEISRDKYMRHDDAARISRSAFGLAND